jgi:hypothetical protein
MRSRSPRLGFGETQSHLARDGPRGLFVKLKLLSEIGRVQLRGHGSRDPDREEEQRHLQFPAIGKSFNYGKCLADRDHEYMYQILLRPSLSHGCCKWQMWEHWTAGTVLSMMDLSMRSSFSESEALKCIHIGLLCVQGSPADRPVMSSVVMMLGSESVSLRAPSKPTFYGRNNVGANSSIASTSNLLDGPRDSI